MRQKKHYYEHKSAVSKLLTGNVYYFDYLMSRELFGSRGGGYVYTLDTRKWLKFA